MSPIASRLVTETFSYGGGRPVTAYVPAAPPEAIVFAGDGQLIASWGSVLEAADLPPTLIVGAHAADDEMLRLQEYSPGETTAAFAFDPERFAAHGGFSSRTCAVGRNRASASRCLPPEPRCSVSLRAANSRSRWGFAIPVSMARSSARRRARGIGRRP